MSQTVAESHRLEEHPSVDYEVIDSDGHVTEVGDDIFPYLEAPFAGNLRLQRRFASFLPSLDGWHRVATNIEVYHARGMDSDAINRHRAPEVTLQPWLDFVGENDISHAVLYPTDLLAFGAVRGTAWPVALARAYNTFLHDRYTRHSTRLRGAALLPVQDGRAAADELQRAVRELGMVAGVVMVSGLKHPLGDRHYDPLYAMAERLDVPLALHAGGSDYLGFDRFFSREIEVLSLSHAHGQMICLVSMMMHGVFERYPRLRVALLEAGAGWLPWLVERMDSLYASRGFAEAPELKAPPSEYLRRGNIFINIEADEVDRDYVQLLVSKVGRADIFLYASDFPHAPVAEITGALAGLKSRTDVGDEVKRAIFSGAAKRLYGFA